MKPSFFKSVSFAVNGLKLAWHEKHFKIHLKFQIYNLKFTVRVKQKNNKNTK